MGRTIKAPSTHHQRTINAPSTHHQRTINAPPTHHQRTINAPRTHHQRTTNPPPTHHDRTINAPPTHHQRTTDKYVYKYMTTIFVRRFPFFLLFFYFLLFFEIASAFFASSEGPFVNLSYFLRAGAGISVDFWDFSAIFWGRASPSPQTTLPSFGMARNS